MVWQNFCRLKVGFSLAWNLAKGCAKNGEFRLLEILAWNPTIRPSSHNLHIRLSRGSKIRTGRIFIQHHFVNDFKYLDCFIVSTLQMKANQLPTTGLTLKRLLGSMASNLSRVMRLGLGTEELKKPRVCGFSIILTSAAFCSCSHFFGKACLILETVSWGWTLEAQNGAANDITIMIPAAK